MFRKDPVAVEEWSSENVEICWQRQRRIIGDIWDTLKPGGVLIYSTCTFNTKEDEENARWIQQEYGAEPLTVQVQENWNITGDLLPDNCDGSKSFLFLSIIFSLINDERRRLFSRQLSECRRQETRFRYLLSPRRRLLKER